MVQREPYKCGFRIQDFLLFAIYHYSGIVVLFQYASSIQVSLLLGEPREGFIQS